ncbi:MAG: hypothetical protein PF450_13800 [Bacteroidales bacterium]|jgi:tetratricopeptide (TPR) repeat protein|nr:hypothetical protein [Bacteroidales bacterium]
MKTKIRAIVLCFFTLHVSGQGKADFDQRLYASYIDEKIIDWKDIIVDMTAKYQENNEPELLYSICFAQYGYIGYCIGNDLEEEAKEALKEANTNAKKLENIYDGRHDILALQGAFLGFEIMLSKFRSLYLGPKAYKLINAASESSDTYFNCSLEIGNMRYFTPKFLGGSKEEAIDYYKNAVKLLESGSKKKDKNWMYINVNLLLAHAYYDTGLEDLACKQYKKILEYEPAVNWIRDEYSEKCQ